MDKKHKSQFIFFILLVSLIGCSNSFNAAQLASSIPTLENCGGCDIAGEGGSIKLMQTTEKITGIPAVSTQSVSSIYIPPMGIWATECMPDSSGFYSSKIFMTVHFVEGIVIGKTYRDIGCKESDLDEVQTLRYSLSSMGTAKDTGGIAANILWMALVQIVREPHYQLRADKIQQDCKKNPDGSSMGSYGLYDVDPVTLQPITMASDGSKAYDTSLCYNSSNPTFMVGNRDETLRFWTDGVHLKLGHADNLTDVGYFTKQ